MPEQHQSSRNFFFLLSGENPELALFEFETIVSTLNISTQIRSSPDNRIVELRFDKGFNEISSLKIVNSLVKRITMVHFCCESLFKYTFNENVPVSFKELTNRFNASVVRNLTPNLSFSVKTRRIGPPIGLFCEKKITQDVSGFIGARIQKENPTKQVDLENPDERFIVVLSRFGFWMGKHVSSSLRNDVRKRTSRKRPFFHPSSMNLRYKAW
jgi:tRNA G10  N-methylase Trm11